MKSLYRYCYLVCLLFMLCISSCRKDETPVPGEEQTIFTPTPNASIKGVYVLNEGNMNSNKASLDYVDYTTGIYHRNIYNEANPEVTKGLGDVGNDLGVYGGKLYIVVNNSNKIEVVDAHTCKRIAQVDLVNCRYICFSGGKAYVSAYLGAVADPKAQQGIVAEIDTATLQITRRVSVGRQPEQLTVVNGNLYVANSGAYSPSDYERTVSVISLASFTETKRIDVAINLDHLKADRYGDLYVSSRGDYYNIPAGLFVIDAQTGTVKKDFGIAASDFWLEGDTMYAYSAGWNYLQGKNIISYSMINVKDETGINQSYITDGTDKSIIVPYGIAVNSETKDVLVTDAKDYVSPGTLYCFDQHGVKKWSVQTGDLPGHFAFIQ